MMRTHQLLPILFIATIIVGCGTSKKDAPILQMKEYVEVKKKFLDDLKPEYRKEGEFILDWFVKDVCPDPSNVKDFEIKIHQSQWRWRDNDNTGVLLRFQDEEGFVHCSPLFVENHSIVRIKLFYDGWLSCGDCSWNRYPELNREIMKAVDKVKKKNPNCIIEYQ